MLAIEAVAVGAQIGSLDAERGFALDAGSSAPVADRLRSRETSGASDGPFNLAVQVDVCLGLVDEFLPAHAADEGLDRVL